MHRIFALVVLAFCGIATLAQTGSQVTNAEIIKMLKAGVDQNTVKWVIENSTTKLDGSPEALQKLKAAGASALGFNFYPKSPRYVHPDRAAAIAATVPPDVLKVAIFVGEPAGTMERVSRQYSPSLPREGQTHTGSGTSVLAGVAAVAHWHGHQTHAAQARC